MPRSKLFVDKVVIIDTAYELIREIGGENFSVRKLAVQLNISPMTIYNYVKNVDAIFKEVIIKAFNAFLKRLNQEMNQSDIPLSIEGVKMAIRIIARIRLEFALENQELFTLMYGPFGMNLENDPELFPYYNLEMQLLYGFSFLDEDTELIRKKIMLLNITINALIFRILSKKVYMTNHEYLKTIDLMTSLYFQD